MRYIIMHKTSAHWEAGAIPDSELIARVGRLLRELGSAGMLLGAEGLRPTSEGVRVRFSGSKPTVTPGPFEHGNELPAGFSIVRTTSLETAVDWATRQAGITGDLEVDIRPVTEPWDIGMQPRPADVATRRYMVLRKGTAATEGDRAPPADARSRLAQLIEETTRSGVHLVTETMRPSRRGRRYTNTANGISYFDGPFAETKELIGGYVIVSCTSFEAACRCAARYMEAVDATEVDIRELE
jgi:hypothetical protein